MGGISLNAVISVLGMLSAVVMVLVKLKPGLDDYFRKGTPVLAEIDDIIDAILVTFPSNGALNTINDLLDKIISELKQAGYKINLETKKKIENRLKARLKRENGLSLKFDPETKEYNIRYKDEF
ncbi:hypothetical protein Halha_1283 [Halobacteroides halobius DSM 5150]|uniref:Uncharacterized protein n=1 Tax=Halobacteroides halobius (strain ATCC 35273 / DSM 5150 / MD-1) TaxID=748449 RepID=L0KA30_HALHC|nr:hypothetical protein [Halobacteroides halobius]AGB41229.1 hypothetical protein Halha_1283 [Halobacteroides halobius DSM 5150]